MDTLSPSEIAAVWVLDKSVETWNSIDFIRTASRLRLSEPTITQNLVLDFWHAAKHRIFPISIFEAVDEKANGNDLELLMETDSGYIKMTIQAKMIKANDKYPTLKHKASKSSHNQIDLLIRYAKKNGAVPLYLFYNCTDNNDAAEKVCEHHGLEFVQYTGMSVVKAQDIKNNYFNRATGKWKIPNFEHLHVNYAFPFFFLFLYEEGYLEGLVNDEDKHIKVYNRDEIMDDDDWNMLVGPRGIGGIMFEKIMDENMIQKQKGITTFSPQFRIVISKKIAE